MVCGYYVGIVENVTEGAIKEYIAAKKIYANPEDQPNKKLLLEVAGNSACDARLLGAKVIAIIWLNQTTN